MKTATLLRRYGQRPPKSQGPSWVESTKHIRRATRRGQHYSGGTGAILDPNYQFELQAVWTQEQSKTARELLTKLKWWEMSLCETSSRRLGRGEFDEPGELFTVTIPAGPQSVFLVLTETGLL